MNRWIVHVKKFGKIEQADVEVAPMTLFVGDNNSGKSYLMTFIYGLLNVRFYFENYLFYEESVVFKNCCRILDNMIPKEHEIQKYTLSCEEIGQFQQLINQILDDNKKKFILNLFNREMTIDELNIEFPNGMNVTLEVELDIDEENNEECVLLNQRVGRSHKAVGYRVSRGKVRSGATGYRFLLSFIMQSMLDGGLGNRQMNKRVYLPTTRTGFLLTYKTLIGSAVQEKFTLQENDKNLLTKPNSDFLKELGSMDTTKEMERFQSVIAFIEEHVINGHVSVSRTPVPDLAYIPEGLNQKLPLYVTSGVVTEMTPLLLFLKYVDMGTLLFEEPEISLHLQLQWQVARVLIRLSNMGLPVFVTTHSDLIIRHINNMIKANEMENRETFLGQSEYGKDDLLSREDIRVYQFEVQENQMTNVHRLPCGDYGFEAMTFYNNLEKMNTEIEQIENEA